MTVDIRVSGNMISTKSYASAEEMSVNDMDIFIFASTDKGYLLEWVGKDVTPNQPEAIPGLKDQKIWSETITLPTSGSKRKCSDFLFDGKFSEGGWAGIGTFPPDY